MATLQTVLKVSGYALIGAFAACAILCLDAANAAAADVNAPIGVIVDCHCPDPVGRNLCAAVKEKANSTSGYRLAGNTAGFGIGVHLSCVDMWKGLNDQLAGHMSAASAAFTIYGESLPGEVFEDVTAFRVGKDSVGEMSTKIMNAVDQLVKMNTSLFDKMRASAGSAPAPEASPSLEPQVTTTPSLE